jgi:hypothetical protein
METMILVSTGFLSISCGQLGIGVVVPGGKVNSLMPQTVPLSHTIVALTQHLFGTAAA